MRLGGRKINVEMGVFGIKDVVGKTDCSGLDERRNHDGMVKKVGGEIKGETGQGVGQRRYG